MIKYALLSFQFLGLLIIGMFSSDEVLIDNQIPTTVEPGDKREITVTIQKNDIQGFAKMEIHLPEGFIATAGKTEGASFTFHDQKARFVWMSMPTAPSFRVTYYLESPDAETIAQEVKGVFSYIKENKRVDNAVPSRMITVTESAIVAEDPATGNMTVSTGSSEDSSTEASLNEAPQIGLTSSVVQDEVGCLRTITQLSPTDFQVDLQIVNNSIKGFAKVLETVPDNCKTEKIQDAGAVVTQERNSIKFVWFEIPQSSTVSCSYKISCLTPQSALPVITGKLSYVENNKPNEVVVVNTLQAASGDVVAEENTPEEQAEPTPSVDNPAENTAENIVKEEPKAPVKTETAEVKTEPKSIENPKNNSPKSTTSKVEEPSEEAVAQVPSPETGITYKVQILASHRVVNKSYFRTVHRFSGKYNIENHEGWVKYTTGKYEEYKQARDAREGLTQEHTTLPGPFVTAYNDGERITVQEALLISKQQWYK